MVEFEVDRDAHDDGGMLAVPVRMAGHIRKCIDLKPLHDNHSFSPTSHLALFLRTIAKQSAKLGFLARIEFMPSLVYIKPYAIWYP